MECGPLLSKQQALVECVAYVFWTFHFDILIQPSGFPTTHGSWNGTKTTRATRPTDTATAAEVGTRVKQC
jgi:hypothetical protein